MRKYIYIGLTSGVRASTSMPWIRRYAKHPEKYDIDKRYSRLHKMVKKSLKGFKVDLHVGGFENVPADTNVIFTPNHQSMLDPIVLIGLIEKTISFLSKIEVEKFLIVGKIVKSIDGVFMDRSNFRDEIKAIGKISKKLEEEPKLSYCIFPEGTRTKDPDMNLGEFKAGALKPAYNACKPIVPVAIYGTHRITDQKIHYKNYPVQIQFLKPHMPEEFENTPTTDMAQIIHDEIAAAVDKMRERDKVLVSKVC